MKSDIGAGLIAVHSDITVLGEDIQRLGDKIDRLGASVSGLGSHIESVLNRLPWTLALTAFISALAGHFMGNLLP